MFNIQIPICSEKGQTRCRSIHELCVADPGFKFIDGAEQKLPQADVEVEEVFAVDDLDGVPLRLGI